MQDVLSQQEIDSLLQALDSGRLDPTEVSKTETETKHYDFRRPNKFSREHLYTLEVMHQQLARLLSNFLSGYLHSDINIEIVSVGQMIYDEFIRSVPTPTVLTVFSVDPLPGSALMETNIQLALPLIDLLLGGSGSPATERELTDIELSILSKLNTKILEYLAIVWKEIYVINPKIEHVETSPRIQQLYSPNEVVALITLSVSINETINSMINICLPFMVLEPAMPMLSIRQQFQVQRRQEMSEQDLQSLKHWLGECRVDLDVRLGSVDITIEEFLHLQIGDTLILDNNINQDIVLNVEDIPKFMVQPGTVNGKKAVQIVSLLEGEDLNVQ